jgi:hypothetical protein
MITLIPSCLSEDGGLLPSATTVAGQFEGEFFQRTFQLTQLAASEGIVWLAFDQEASRMGFVVWASHLAPSLAVLFMPEVTGAVRRDIHLATAGGDGNGNDVTEIFRHDIGDDEVDFLRSICRSALEFDDVAGAVIVAGGLDLDAPKVFAGVEDEVVALAVSPGFGDAEAETGDFGKECSFGGFSEGFGSREADCMDFRNLEGHGTFQILEK